MHRIIAICIGLACCPAFVIAADEVRLQVATLNVNAIPFYSPTKKVRIEAICRAVLREEIDVVVFQEHYARASRKRMRRHLDGYDVVSFPRPGILGSGLTTASHFPMSDPAFTRFTLNGKRFADRNSGKGVSRVGLTVAGRDIDVFNTHVLARWGTSQPREDDLTPERMMNLFRIFTALLGSAPTAEFILGGDLNFKVGHREFDFFRQLTSLEIALLDESGAVCTFCAENTFNKGGIGQLDYVFVSPGLAIENAEVGFQETIETSKGTSNLSDHFGLLTTVVLRDSPLRDAAVREKTLSALRELSESLTDYAPRVKGKKKRRVEKAARMVRDHVRALGDDDLSAESTTLLVALDAYFNRFGTRAGS